MVGTTQGNIGNKAQAAIHSKGGTDRSKYQYSDERGTGVGIYASYDGKKPLAGNKNTGLDLTYSAGAQIGTEHMRSKVSGSVGIEGHTKVGPMVLGAETALHVEYAKDPADPVIHGSFPKSSAVWGETTVSAGLDLGKGKKVKGHLGKTHGGGPRGYEGEKDNGEYSAGIQFSQDF